MENLNQAEWFRNRKKFNFVEFTAEGVPFNLMPLTAGQIADVKEADSLVDMFKLASEFGLSVGRDRIFDDEIMTSDIDCFWALPEMNVDADPSIQYQVGEKVCEISGLAEHVKIIKQVELEAAELEANKINVGGTDLDLRDPIDNLNDDANAVAVTNSL